MPMNLSTGAVGRLAAVAVLAAALGGCNLGGSDGGNNSMISSSPEPSVLPASEIHNILAGKSWRFQGPNNTGTTLYAEDGTSLVEVDGKGTTRGKWQTKDGQLCESFDPAPFLPGGVPMSCYPFSGSGGNYKAGKATFSLAS